ncbi:hypothetical protein UAW_00275 [Enterococcus haemoperoxidus ATCC BAA-382]|uniref:DUF4809 domain-containing protein n=1 Tax=Enterococcus haemoperoxidus ATCC BAA-382 TaxID=1158608 RepID=R2QXK0_9ENTE|nr:DUF4809 family protein [Enterococcus haemoperoxidus]EOI00101.1 hypothetical protein UAW_00275 [Enterococcus haemoperoxidus ATCC BAA-382]EOT63133.1 hypothetical protein I583_02136 [Enterococcus haemoperoxidus ATCC BAA-382]OJG53577.1 hypothetical protein RV06_GL000651 [Enterococcus haemoperoxidus]
MKKALISKTVNLLDGGCNACGIIEDENYTLTIDEQVIPLEALTVNSLITAIALKNGYKREYEIDVIDDYTLYKKEDHQVTLKEEYDFLTYTNGAVAIETRDQITDEKKLVEKVNEILVAFFNVEELAFCF